MPAAELTVGAVDFDDAVFLRNQRSAEAGAVGAGAFDAKGVYDTVAESPVNELPITFSGRGH
jgi:hypothetical protein